MLHRLMGFAFAFALALPAAAEENASTTIFRNVTIIDGTGSPAQPDMTIVITRDTIERVAPSGSIDVKSYPKAAIIDASGQYALPGLIDTHVHTWPLVGTKDGPRIFARFLYSGVTSVRDMAGDARVLANQARRAKLNLTASPNIYYSALMAGPSFFTDPRPAASAQGEVPGEVPWLQAITPDIDMPLAVAQAKGTFATGVKIYANLEASEVRRITEEAHRQGMKVWAHSSVFPAGPGDVVAAGVDSISHVCRMVFEISSERPSVYDHSFSPDYANLSPGDPRIRAIYADMRARGTILDATVWLYKLVEERELQNPERKPKRKNCSLDYVVEQTRVAHQMGVEIATGTDSYTPVEDAYPGLFEEIDILVEQVGMTPLEVIRSATLVGAMTIGIEETHGTLEEGKRADLVFLSANPLDDIGNLRTVVLTVKDGHIFARKDFEEGAYDAAE